MCQHFSGHIIKQLFKFYRWQVSIVRMEALSIVEDFDGVEDRFSGSPYKTMQVVIFIDFDIVQSQTLQYWWYELRTHQT